MDFTKKFRIYGASGKNIRDYNLEEITLQIDYKDKQNARIQINNLEQLCKLINHVGEIVIGPGDEFLSQCIIIYDYYLE